MDHDDLPLRPARPTPRVLHAVTSVPWAIDPDKLGYIAELLSMRARGFAPNEAEVQFALDGRSRDARDARPYQVVEGTAVIPLYGVLAPRMNLLVQFSGGTSTLEFSEAVDQAADDSDVREILIDADSPGGATVGSQEAFDALARADKKKRVTAVGTNQLASAAYWICSAARTLIASPSCWVGSIGVYTLHVDQTRRDEKEGLKVSIVQRGRHKTDGSPHKPLDAQGRRTLQEEVDTSYSMMLAAIARGRKVSVSAVDAQFGQGRAFVAADAKALGMIDRVATLKEVLGELVASVRDGSGSIPPRLAWLIRQQERAQHQGDQREAAAIASMIESEKRAYP